MNVPTKPLNKPLFNKHCRVCGDKATCFNFCGLSCETCKIFFRRNASNGDKLKCRRDGNCPIDSFTRKCCPKCRLDKCFAIGMRFKVKKYQRFEVNDDMNNDGCSDNNNINNNTDTIVCTQNDSSCSDDSEHQNIRCYSNVLDYELKRKRNASGTMSDSESSNDLVIEQIKKTKLNNDNPPQPFTELTDYELKLIQEIQHASRAFVDEDKLPLLGETTDLVYALNLPAIYMNRITQYCSRIATFNTLNKEDQLIILRNFYFEILSVRFAYFFNTEKDGFPVMEDDYGKRSIIIKMKVLSASKREQSEEIGRNLLVTLKHEMENDPIVRDLLITQFLFKPREGLSCTDMIRYHYCVYRHLMVKYLECKYRNTPQASRKYSKLMSLINEHWMVKEIIRDLLMDIGPHQVSHILSEVYNIS